MAVFSAALLLIPIVIGIAIALSVLPLYISLKLFNVPHNTWGMALKVSLIGWLASIGVGMLLNIVGFIIPVLPQIAAMLAPFAIYAFLIQHYYQLELVPAVIISVIEVAISYVLAAALVMAILIPLGVGAALFSIGS